MNTPVAALFEPDVFDEALAALPSDPEFRGSVWFGCRSARVLEEQCAQLGMKPLRSAVRESGPLADLARLVSSDDRRNDAFHDELLSLGVDAARAAVFEQSLSGDQILLVIPRERLDETMLRALLDAGADAGLENGGGSTHTFPLRREVLEVLTTVVPDNEVTYRTEVIVETKRLEIELERQEVVIERRDLSVDGAAVEITRIAIKHEEAVIQKRVVVTAEVVVRTEQYVEASVVHEELRHEVFGIADGAEDG